MKKKNDSPQLARWLLNRLLLQYSQSPALGDLEEEFELLVEEIGLNRARQWYRRQVLRSIPSCLSHIINWSGAMIHNYLKVAMRNLKRHKVYSFINITGLSIGMACCILILLYVHHELHYDTYHADQDRIFRVVVETKFYKRMVLARTSDLAAPRIVENYPQVEAAARIQTGYNVLVKSESNMFYEEGVYYADSDLFNIFTIPFRRGDPVTALSRPGTAVLSETLANKLFGEEDPIGRIIHLNEYTTEVTGVVANAPTNTHLPYRCFVSFSTVSRPTRPDWTRFDCGTYIKLRAKIDVLTFREQIASLTEQILPPENGGERRQTYLLQPIADIHMDKDMMWDFSPHGNRLFLLILVGIGTAILFIACMNFINLATARATKRAREVGMRKVAGAQVFQLLKQFLGESFFITGLAFVGAMVIAYAVLPLFKGVTGIQFIYTMLFQGKLIVQWLCLIGIVGLMAGFYPAVHLSSLQPAAIFKKQDTSFHLRGYRFQSLLIISQFAASIALVICTLTMNRQVHYMKNQPLGFAKEQKLVLPFPDDDGTSRNFQTIKNVFSDYASIRSSTVSSGVPGRSVSYAGTIRSEEDWSNPTRVNYIFGDEDFLKVFQIQPLAGELRDQEGFPNLKAGFVVNEALLKAFGWRTSQEALGHRLLSGYFEQEGITIVGVVRDFHFAGFHKIIEPIVLTYRSSDFRMITLTVDTQQMDEVFRFLRTRWKEVFPDHPFDYFFVDENFDQQYRQDENLSLIITIFAFLGISIACFGLFGLAVFTAEQRTKEIGIRKVVGASVSSIIFLLSRQFTRWVLLANVIAWPMAYFLMRQWLNAFAYRVSIGLGVFIISALIAFGIALLTVSYQAVRAALANPIEALRYE